MDAGKPVFTLHVPPLILPVRPDHSVALSLPPSLSAGFRKFPGNFMFTETAVVLCAAGQGRGYLKRMTEESERAQFTLE